jgi:Fis family transcriptional regulator, factor for inversion stimulation protein
LPKKNRQPEQETARRHSTKEQVGTPQMSKEHIQEVVKKSLEKYFRDLGEQRPSNVYEMVVLTVEKPILEAVMERAQGNQSHAAEMLGINRNTLRKKLQQHGLI